MHCQCVAAGRRLLGGNLSLLRGMPQVANQVIAECGGEGGAHWLDSGTEHPHRIALSVQASCVPSAVAGLQQGCHARGLQVTAAQPHAMLCLCCSSSLHGQRSMLEQLTCLGVCCCLPTSIFGTLLTAMAILTSPNTCSTKHL